MSRCIHVLIPAFSAAITAAALIQSSLPTPVRAQSTDPCAATAAAATAESTPAREAESPTGGSKTRPLDYDNGWGHLNSLWAHRAAVAGHRVKTASVNNRSEKIGEIAILRDVGDLVMAPNPFDLGDVGLRFTPNSQGGYDISRVAYGFRQPLGSAVVLADDDTREVALPFSFTFFGQRRDRVFVNSDGNVTFSSGDTDTSARSISRFLTGPPRIALFFADLDPSASGRVVTASNADTFSVTWCGVREYNSSRVGTVQVTLLPNDVIEMQVSNGTTIRDAIVGVSPGQTTEFTAVDLTADGPIAGAGSAVGERFATASDLDIVNTARRFLATNPDEYDNLVIFTDVQLLKEAFAYEVSVANSLQGLNLPVFDDSKEYGSSGHLQSLCNMDALAKYPDDPRKKFLGENSTVSVMGQEVGHRWLAFLAFRDHTMRTSRALLGRDGAHWSFFFDSDASVLEGNDIEDLGSGHFRTVSAVRRYSMLDQYAMGLVDQTQVPPFFYVESPTNIVPSRTAVSAPEVGVTFDGIRRDVTIDDVIAVVGRRVPSAAESPRVYRQAFVYVVSAGRTVDAATVAKLDRIRVAWDQFFSAATDSRMKAETRLTTSSSTSR
jgi:hypothetical protein